MRSHYLMRCASGSSSLLIAKIESTVCQRVWRASEIFVWNFVDEDWYVIEAKNEMVAESRVYQVTDAFGHTASDARY
jgi:hypothetical protein